MLQFEIVDMDAVDENVLRQVPHADVVRRFGKRVRSRRGEFRRLLRFESFDPIGKDAEHARPEYEEQDLPPISVLISQKTIPPRVRTRR